MGARESSSPAPLAVGTHTEPQDPHTSHYRELYVDLSATDEQGTTDDGGKAFRERFVSYFGGPCVHFGSALCDHLLSEPGPVTEGQFVKGLQRLRAATLATDHHLLENFYFNVFSHGQDSISKEDLTSMLHSAATYGLVIGSELHEQVTLSSDHHYLTSLSQAAWVHAESAVLFQSQFVHWLSVNCPGLLEGVRQWVTSQLTQSGGSVSYQLPSPDTGKQLSLERHIDLCTLVWVLSTTLPMLYMGHTQTTKDRGKVGSPVGGDWSTLYSSDQHGLSMNRFQHHCSDYRHPSVLALSCYQSTDNAVYQFVIALDTEWRDGTYQYGGDDSLLVQLRPTLRVLKRGPKLVSLNEKQRGFPTGLRVTHSDGTALLHVDPSLETANYLGDSLSVERVQVWGCGGAEATESQRRMKEWEKRQVLLRGKVKREQLAETWENSPDRYLLELGGVTAKRPTEQQQQ